jgi:hypothetical protein
MYNQGPYFGMMSLYRLETVHRTMMAALSGTFAQVEKTKTILTLLQE